MRKLLIVNPFGIGDAIFSMAVVEAIRLAEPDAFIGFVCNERTAGLVRLNPSIDRAFLFNRDRFRRLWGRHPFLVFQEMGRMLEEVKEERFDVLLDYSLGREFSFYAMLAGISKRIGFDFKNRGLFLTHKKKIAGYEARAVTDMQLDLLNLIGISFKRGVSRLPIRVSDEARSILKISLAKAGIHDLASLIAIAPGGGKSWGPNAVYKQWDLDRFVETANRLAVEYRSRFVFLGGRDEEDLLRALAGRVHASSLCLAGEDFERVGAALQISRFLLCNDGGLLHLANALGVKTVSIFGPVEEAVYGPYGDQTTHEVVTESVACRPCYHRFHFPPCKHDRQCLTQVSPDRVLAAIKRIDSRPRAELR